MPGGADHVADLSGKGRVSEASGRTQPCPAAETPRDSVGNRVLRHCETRWHLRSRQPDQVAHTPDVRTRKSRTPPQAGPAPRMKPTHDSGSVFEHGERRAVVRHLQRERQVTMEEVTSATVTGLPLRTLFRVGATAVDSERSGRVEMPSNPGSALRVRLTDAHRRAPWPQGHSSPPTGLQP